MIHGFYFQPVFPTGDAVTHLWNAPDFIEDVARDGLVFGTVERLSESLGESINSHETIHGVGAIRPRLHFRTHALLCRIEFILYLPDNLFQNVFQGDDPSRPSIFVDDD